MHFLQSEAWQKFQESQGKKVFYRNGEGWEYRAILEENSFAHRLYCPYGPTVSDARSMRNSLESLYALANSHDITYIRIQPLGYDLTPEITKEYHLKKIEYPQPGHTWCIDVSRPKEDILADMKQNNRSIYRNYSKKGLRYERSTDPGDITHLTTLLSEVASHNKISVHSDKYFEKQAKSLIEQNAASIHLMYLDDVAIAAALVYEGEETNYYAHAAASHEHRKLNASTALLAEIIFNAKAQGKKTCDLYGITTSDDSTHRWAGFTKFKKSFGGYQKDLSDTYELPVKRVRYTLFRFARTVRKLIASM